MQLVRLLVVRLDKEVLANVFVAATTGMALTKPENFIYAVHRSNLDCDHAARLFTKLLLVGWVEKLAIPLVAGALL